MHINSVDFFNCTGCSACAAKCPHKAIEMKENNDGFLYPVVVEDKCTNCELCVKICPALHVSNEENELKECYAAMASDEIRQLSSSGGVFTVLAEYILSQNGYVCGAAFDDNLQLSHKIINNVNELDKLRRSKYIESHINNAFSDIKALLKNDKYVLFSGTPCQVAGLKAYLGKEYEKLYTIDLVCKGPSSPKVFKKYLSEQFKDLKIYDYNFREKAGDWNNICGSVITEHGKQVFKAVDDLFYKFYFPKINIRKGCDECSYAKLNRVADITLGDFWGIKDKRPDLDDGKGTSLIFLNTSKGKELFLKCRKTFKKCENVPVDYTFKNTILNPNAHHIGRTRFFSNLDKCSLYENMLDVTNIKNNILIFNTYNSNTNFGSVLTGFALNYFLNNCCDGRYSAQNLEFKLDVIKNESKLLINEDAHKFPNGINPAFASFRRRYIPSTSERFYMRGLPYYNTEFTHFIVGSDQMFNTAGYNEWFAVLLQFVKNDKNIISCAASFGGYNFDSDDEIKEMYKQSLSRFDSISIREKQGVEICKNLGLHAEDVLDPVFYIEPSVYYKIAQTAADKQTSSLVCYSVGDNFWNGLKNYFENGQSKYFNKYDNIKRLDYHMSIESWLYHIMNCELLITNSFHGVCFAIIFGKEFISINSKSSSDRVISLLEDIGIEGHKFYSIAEIDINIVEANKIDYQKVYDKLKIKKEKSIHFLLNALESFENTDEKENHKSIFLHKLIDFYTKKHNECLKKLETDNGILSKDDKDKLNNDILNYKAFIDFINNN